MSPTSNHIALFSPTVPGEPLNLQAEAINSSTIFVEWRPPQTRNQNGIIRGYQVYYVELDGNNNRREGSERMFDTGDGNYREAVVTGLAPATNYSIKVAAYTRRGDGSRSRGVTVTTKGAGQFIWGLQIELINSCCKICIELVSDL